LFKTFNVRVIVLRAFSIDPFQILKKLNCNVYIINFDINSIFNIEDLVDYKGFDFNPSNLLMNHPMSLFLRPYLPPISNILPNTVGQINKILAYEVSMTRKYLVR